MKKIKSRLLAYLMFIAIATICLASVSQAAATKKTLAVLFGSINVQYNNQDVTNQVTPIIANGRTYLPLRSMANLFNKELSLSGNTIYLSDKSTQTSITTDSAYISLQNQLASKDAYIQTLVQKVSNLESTINSINSTNSSSSNNNSITSSLNDLEDDLNDDYESYKDTDFEISLSGDKNNITVAIKTDEEDWNDISNSNQENFMENIVDDIQDVFKTADIQGKIKDGSSTLIEFSAKSNEDVVIDTTSLVDNLVDELADKLDDDDFGTLTSIDNDDLEIAVEGNTDDLTFTIKIDFDDYEDEWDNLSETAINDYMKKVYDYIVDQSNFEDTDVIGYFYDIDGEDNLVKIYNDGKSFKQY